MITAMYKIDDDIPKPLAKRIQAIRSGAYTLNTPKDIKDFWLFAIEQRNVHKGAQRSIAFGVTAVTFWHKLLEERDDFLQAGGGFASLEYIGSPENPRQSQEAYAEELWHKLKKTVVSLET